MLFQNELKQDMNVRALDPTFFQVRKSESEPSRALLSERLINYEISLPEAQHYFNSSDLFTWKIAVNIEPCESNANFQNLSIESYRDFARAQDVSKYDESILKTKSNLVTKFSKMNNSNYASLDPLALYEIVMKIILPLIDEHKRMIKMKDDIIKIWENKYTQFNYVIEYLKFIKDHAVDNNNQVNIELAKIQHNNNVKIEEMRLELLKTQLNYVKEKSKMDTINSILTNILTRAPEIKELHLPSDTSVNEELNHSDKKNELKYEAQIIDEKHLQTSESILTVK